MSDPSVSIIIPTYYRNEQLEDAITSALSQDYDNIEVIVVDDSGEHHAEPVVKGYDVEYIPHKENRGGNPARNTGYEAASGQYIQFLDDDDKLFERKISKQVELLEDSRTADVAYCGLIERDGSEVRPDSDEEGRSLELALQLFWPSTLTSSLLISDSVLSEVYPLTNRSAADDIGMKIELAKRTNFEFVDEILVKIGESDVQRSFSMDFVEELEYIYEEYEEEYEKMPSYVRRTAISSIELSRAEVLLAEKNWSPRATYSYFLAALYKPGVNPLLLTRSIVSLFGAPGQKLATALNNKLELF